MAKRFAKLVHSCNAQDDVDTGVGVYKARNLTDLEGEGSLFEWCLHLTSAKEVEVSSVGCRAALAVLSCKPHKVIRALDLGGEVLNVGDCLFLGASDSLASGSNDGVAGASVLLEDVTAANLVSHFALFQDLFNQL